MSPGAGKALLVRVATGLALVAVVLVLVWTPALRPALALFVTGLVAVGLYEYFALVRARGIEAESNGGIVLGALLTLSGYWASKELMGTGLAMAVLGVSALHLFQRKHTIAGLAASVFGVIYLGWLPAHFLAVHGMPGRGPGLVMVFLVAVILADTGGYFAGRAFGRHKLAPKVSPNKTVEGAIGGLTLAAVGMLILYALHAAGWRALPAWTVAWYVFAGLILAAVSQVGDLVESMLKRDAGLKDSGRIFPGHGGVLDRCDGLLFAAPVLYYLAIWGPRW
jgi:phosphatidate cytidylyltransferase